MTRRPPPRRRVERETLQLVCLRHSDGDLEAVLRGLVAGRDPRVGASYGSGRVTASGRSRFAEQVDPAHPRAIASLDATRLREAVAVGNIPDLPRPSSWGASTSAAP